MNKKVSLLILPLALIPSFSLSSCGETSVLTNSDLLISEMYFGSGAASEALELYNKGEKDIDLTSYTVEVFASTEVTSSRITKLSGTLKAKDTFVIASSEYASEEVLDIADMSSDYYKTNGKWAVALKRGSAVIDVLGYIGFGNVDYGSNVTLVRKVDMFESKNAFDQYDFIRYTKDNMKYLGNVINSVTPEELLAGPKITQEDLKNPFFAAQNEALGGGGVVNVSLRGCIDGDTSKFNYPQELNDKGITDGTSVRYHNIDTPESYSGNIQPWGIPAKEYTCKALNSDSSHIRLQSVKNGIIRETFNRILGYVWVGDTLLNYKIVLEGYSGVQFDNVETMFYKDISYYNYFKNAEFYASKYKLKIHGELDPTWDYENNRPKG